MNKIEKIIMKSKRVCFVIIIVGVITLGCNNEHNSNIQTIEDLNSIKNERDEEIGDWENYVSEKDSFLISYPSDWKREDIEGVQFAVRKNIGDNFSENFHMRIHKVEERITLKEFAKLFYEQQQETYSEFKFHFIGDGTINNDNKLSTYFIDYSVKNDELNIYTLNVFIMVRDNIYQLNFYSKYENKEENEKIFDQVIASLIIL